MAEKNSTTIICERCGEVIRPGETLCPMCKMARAPSVYTLLSFLTNREGNRQGNITLLAEKGSRRITVAVSERPQNDVVYLSLKEAQELIDKLTYCLNPDYSLKVLKKGKGIC